MAKKTSVAAPEKDIDISTLDEKGEADLDRSIQARLGIKEDEPDGDDVDLEADPADDENLLADEDEPASNEPDPADTDENEDEPDPAGTKDERDPDEPPEALIEPDKPKEPEVPPYAKVDEKAFEKAYGVKAGTIFKALKKDLAAALETIKKHAETTATDPSKLPADVKLLQQRLELSETELGKVKLEATQTFKNKHDVPIGRKFTQLQDYLKRAGIEEPVAQRLSQQLLNMPLKERTALLQEHLKNPIMAARADQQVDDIQELIRNRATELSDWRKSLSTAQQDEERGGFRMAEAQRTKLMKDALTEEQKAKNFMFTELPGAVDWNKVVTSNLAKARQVLDSNDPALQVRHMIKGVAYDRLMVLYRKQLDRTKKLQAELEEFSGATGRLGAGGDEIRGSKGKKTRKGEMTGDEAVGALMNDEEDS